MQRVHRRAATATAVRRAGLWAAVMALGLWVSWHYAFVTWSTESDSAFPYVLWEGLHEHGWRFLASFGYAPDNWLLWPMPLLFAAFATVGTMPPVAFAVGWLLFVGSVGLAFCLVRRAAGTGAGLACAAVLLFSSRAAIGELGFLSYPVSHNAPLLLGLAAVLSGTASLDRRRWSSLAGVTALLAAAGLADPWTNAAFTLPLLGAAAVLATVRRPDRDTAAKLALAAALAFVLAQTRLFGALWFLPSAPLTFASAEGRGLGLAWLGRLLATWFNAVPLWGQGYAWMADGTQTAVNLALLAAAGCASAAMAVRHAGRDIAFDLLWLTGMASIGVVCAAFVLLDFPQVISVGRFFVAAYVFVIGMCAAAAGRAWPGLSRPARLCVLACALPLPLAGLASAPSAWATWRIGVANDRLRSFGAGVPPFYNDIASLAAFLRARGLRFGYGGYWANEANAVAWVTRGAVQLRPVSFAADTGAVTAFFTAVSPLWYAEPDGPRDDPATFLVITPGFLACADVARCAAAAAEQFGPPRQALTYQQSTILVWDHRLFAR